VVSNPEFLSEGRAVEDFTSPDRIVIGSFDQAAGDRAAALYEDFDAPVVRPTFASAEMDKPGSSLRLAIVAPGDFAFGLGRMYSAYREMNAQSTKQVAVLRALPRALGWLGLLGAEAETRQPPTAKRPAPAPRRRPAPQQRGEKEKGDALYLHRIVLNMAFRDEKAFKHVLAWAVQFAREKQLQYIRMDTWADNEKIIGYYTSYGFRLIENYTTPDTTDLPLQHRNLNIGLLELHVQDNRPFDGILNSL